MKVKNNKKTNFNESETKINLGFKQTINKFWYKRKILVEMIMFNGDKEFFIAQVDDHNTFKRGNELKYIVNPDELVYYKSFKMFGALYHENLSIPINQNINIDECRKLIEQESYKNIKILDAINNINPTTLNTFSDTKVIEDSIRGAGASKVFAFIKLMTILILIGVIVALLMLNNIKPLF